MSKKTYTVDEIRNFLDYGFLLQKLAPAESNYQAVCIFLAELEKESTKTLDERAYENFIKGDVSFEKKIQAIKLLRDQTQCGLREAKYAVETAIVRYLETKLVAAREAVSQHF